MPQSYLGPDRFSAFDRAFEGGVQLGSQVVRERQASQEREQTRLAQQAAEQQAAEQLAQNQIRVHAANEATDLQAKMQFLKDQSVDPVLKRQKMITDDRTATFAAFDKQDALNAKNLDPNNPWTDHITPESRAASSVAIQANVIRRQKYDILASQPIDAHTPILLPSQNQDVAYDPGNDIKPEYTQAYLKQQADESAANLAHTKAGTANINSEISARTEKGAGGAGGGLKPAEVRARLTAIHAALGPIEGLSNQPNPDEDPAGFAAYGKAIGDFHTHFPNAVTYLQSPTLIRSIAGVSQEEAVDAAALANTSFAEHLPANPTPGQVVGWKTALTAATFDGNPARAKAARTLLRVIGTPVPPEPEPAPQTADAPAEGQP
jgi:hypothetical protein